MPNNRFRPQNIREGIEGSGKILGHSPVQAAEVQSVSSVQLAVTQEADFGTGDFTTTNTSAWQTLHQVDINIPSGNYALHFAGGATFQHSAAPAEASFRIIIFWDDGLSNAYDLQKASNLYLATANKNSSCRMADIYSIPVNLPSVLPGLRRISFDCFNHTAGTLKIVGADIPSVSAFVVGDQT